VLPPPVLPPPVFPPPVVSAPPPPPPPPHAEIINSRDKIYIFFIKKL
jgi:hypothetical protein